MSMPMLLGNLELAFTFAISNLFSFSLDIAILMFFYFLSVVDKCLILSLLGLSLDGDILNSRFGGIPLYYAIDGLELELIVT
jgi:hypothetical protein